jgi:hypothetical protein
MPPTGSLVKELGFIRVNKKYFENVEVYITL